MSDDGLPSEADSDEEAPREKHLGLADLLDIPSLQTLVDGCVELSGVGLALFDEEGNRLVEAPGSHAELCVDLSSSAESGVRCAAARQGFPSPAVPRADCAPPEMAEAGVAPCFYGLLHLIAPVRWEGRVLGRISLGPLKRESLLPLGVPKEIPAGDIPSRWAALPVVSYALVVRSLVHVQRTVQAMMVVGHRTHRIKELHWRSMEDAYGQLERRSSELQEMKAKLAELDRLKSSFLATVSHELRTPLTAIIGYSEMLNERLAGPLNREQAEYVRTILDKSEMLLKLISSILDVSEIEAKKVRLQFEWVEAADVVQSALLSMRPQATQAGVQVHAELPEQAVLVRADVQKLRQVIVNLLANAVKFTPRGGRVVVSLSAKKWQSELSAEGYRISVQDSGVGIPPDQFDKIFQSFYQVDSSFTRGFGGAGLGLAIVKSFVEAHGGVVRLESEVGRGSHFAAVFPAVPPISNGRAAPFGTTEGNHS